VAAKDLALAPVKIDSDLRADGEGYVLQLRAPQWVRALWIAFEGHDVTLDDNALDLLPGESVTLHLRSDADLATLRRTLRLTSLTDTR